MSSAFTNPFFGDVGRNFSARANVGQPPIDLNRFLQPMGSQPWALPQGFGQGQPQSPMQPQQPAISPSVPPSPSPLAPVAAAMQPQMQQLQQAFSPINSLISQAYGPQIQQVQQAFAPLANLFGQSGLGALNSLFGGPRGG